MEKEERSDDILARRNITHVNRFFNVSRNISNLMENREKCTHILVHEIMAARKRDSAIDDLTPTEKKVFSHSKKDAPSSDLLDEQKIFWHEEERPNLPYNLPMEDMFACLEYMRTAPFNALRDSLEDRVGQSWDSKKKEWIQKPACWFLVNTDKFKNWSCPSLLYQVHFWYNPDAEIVNLA